MYKCFMTDIKMPKLSSAWEYKGPLILKGNAIGRQWKHGLINLNVIRSMSTFKNGEKWIHVSLARPDALPSWADVAKVKEEFIGPFREAFHCLPSKESAIDFKVFCLHIWSPTDPEFELPNLMKLISEEML